MNIRQLMFDVDKALQRPSLVEIAASVEAVNGVEGLSIMVTEVDMETVGMEITIEGENLSYDALVNAIEKTGAVVHSVDQLIAGKRLITPVRRVR
ncbi:MAG TPA: DUF211 domain-containing protein [Parafilimonas sp.]|nr:DUF211 domain-containing protein [Parafilimonas sp.]